MQVHHHALCVKQFGSAVVNGTYVPVLLDERGAYGSWYIKGWMKTSATFKAILLGYDCMFLDIDMVALKNPLMAIQPFVDVAVTVDCQEEYEPRTSK